MVEHNPSQLDEVFHALADGTRRFATLTHYAGRGVVTTATYEARALGVHSGMGLMTAAALAPHAVLLPADFDEYRKYSRLFKAAVAMVGVVKADPAAAVAGQRHGRRAAQAAHQLGAARPALGQPAPGVERRLRQRGGQPQRMGQHEDEGRQQHRLQPGAPGLHALEARVLHPAHQERAPEQLLHQRHHEGRAGQPCGDQRHVAVGAVEPEARLAAACGGAVLIARQRGDCELATWQCLQR